MKPLKLLAMDEEDLEVLSAHLQDALLRVADMAYLPSQKRFAVVANRFDWEDAAERKKGKGRYQRRRTALRFDRVMGAQVQGIELKAKNAVLELLAIRFEPKKKKEPDGHVTLYFAGGGAVRLQVECIEAEMKDLGPVWRTRSRPEHKSGAG